MTAVAKQAQGKQIWTVVELIRWTANYLKEKGFGDARLEVERLLAHVLGCDRVGLYLQFDRPLTPEELARFKALLKRRLAHEPLQYVLGETEFHGLRLRVDRRVLIPRPETEQLVDVCLEIFGPGPRARVLDVGTGSGNIVLALARSWPKADCVGADISAEALAVAEENARLNGLEDRVRFVRADLFSQDFADRVGRGFDLVVSNPPYVRPDEWEGLQPEITQYEPREALVAEPDGLAFYRRLALLAPKLLRSNGVLAVEIGAAQAAEVREIFGERGLQQIELHRDLAGRDRVVVARLGAQDAGRERKDEDGGAR